MPPLLRRMGRLKAASSSPQVGCFFPISFVHCLVREMRLFFRALVLEGVGLEKKGAIGP